MENENCPCKRVKCERHGDCAACRAHHSSTKKQLTACDKAKRKEERANTRNEKRKSRNR